MEPILFTNPHEPFYPLSKGPRNRRERRQALKNPRLFNNRKRTLARSKTKIQFVPAARFTNDKGVEIVHEARYIQH